MDHYFLLGNPIEHSKSPAIHARFAELTGEALTYAKQLVAIDGFAEALDALQRGGARGCNITVPFKLQAFEAATIRSERAELAGACNTLVIGADGALHADNTDGIGLVHDVHQNAGFNMAGRDVLLIGAGGAAAGVIGPLLWAGPRRLAIANRTPEKAAALVARHSTHPSLRHLLQKTSLSSHGLHDVDGSFDLVINATSSSLSGAAVPVDGKVLKPGALAYDMMYGPSAQGFRDWALAHGATARDGLGMLVEQAAEAFELWRGVRPPSSQVLDEMRAAMGLPG
ncbi:MAG: shikimate dehydrogenase [Comamonadaceae bacterium]|nr:MAG: shikimate dehydrogenase [Comamonadaceae bacterium]